MFACFAQQGVATMLFGQFAVVAASVVAAGALWLADRVVCETTLASLLTWPATVAIFGGVQWLGSRYTTWRAGRSQQDRPPTTPVARNHWFDSCCLVLCTACTAYCYLVRPGLLDTPITERAAAWLVDLGPAHLLVAIYVAANLQVPIWLHYAVSLAVCSMALPCYMLRAPHARKPRGRVWPTCLAYAAIGLLQSANWMRRIRIWSATHCLIDGLIDLDTAPGVFSATMIILFYALLVVRVWTGWVCVESRPGLSPAVFFVLGLAVMVAAFYDVTPALALFCIVDEVRRPRGPSA